MFNMKTASLAFLMATSAFAAPIAKRGAYVPVRVPFLGITCLLRDISRCGAKIMSNMELGFD